MGFLSFFSIENKTRNFDEKRGIAALLIKIPGFISYVILKTFLRKNIPIF